MKLTPIKVRGKRTTNAPKKRKMADLTIADAVEPPRKFSKRRAKKSLLEREIPLEIMERFFILSENTNFPLCSPLLGRLLSGRHTLVATVIAAFGPTWEIGFGFKYIEDCWSFLGQPTPTGNPVFQVSSTKTTTSPSAANLNLSQSAILECRWATVDLLLEAQQKWGRSRLRPGQEMHGHLPGLALPGSFPPSKAAWAAWIEQQPDVVGPYSYSPSQELLKVADVQHLVPAPDFGPFIQRTDLNSSAATRLVKKAPTVFSSLHKETVNPQSGEEIKLFDVHALLEKDMQELRESIKSTPHTKPWTLSTYTDFFLDVHPRTIIPNHLITGPWDKEKIERLIWLRRGGAVLHESQSWEVSCERSGSNLMMPY
jgi:hypothetical protein